MMELIGGGMGSIGSGFEQRVASKSTLRARYSWPILHEVEGLSPHTTHAAPSVSPSYGWSYEGYRSYRRVLKGPPKYFLSYTMIFSKP